MANHVFSEYIAKFPKVNPKDSQCIDGYEKHLALINFTKCDHQDKDSRGNYSGMRSLQNPGIVVIQLEPDMKGLLQPLIAKNFNDDDEIECIHLQLDDKEPEEQYQQKIFGWKISSLGDSAVEIKYWKYEMKIYDSKGPTIEYGWDFRKQKATHM